MTDIMDLATTCIIKASATAGQAMGIIKPVSTRWVHGRFDGFLGAV